MRKELISTRIFSKVLVKKYSEEVLEEVPDQTGIAPEEVVVPESELSNPEYFANFAIEDMVSFTPTAKQAEDMMYTRDTMYGKIVSVKFTAAKVFYTIVDDYHGKLFEDVPSDSVYSY